MGGVQSVSHSIPVVSMPRALIKFKDIAVQIKDIGLFRKLLEMILERLIEMISFLLRFGMLDDSH